MPSPYTAACDQLSSIRFVIDTLQRVNERLFEAQLTKESADVLDAAVQLAKVYQDLIKVASKPPALASPKNSDRTPEELPF